MTEKKIKVKRGALIGKYFKSIKAAVKHYNSMSKEARKLQSIVEFGSGECMIVGNSTISAITR